MLAYWVRLKGCEVGHRNVTVLDDLWEYTSRKGRGFGWTGETFADESGLMELEVGPSVVMGDVPPLLLTDPVVDLTLKQKIKYWSEVSDIGELVDNYIGRIER